MTLLTIDAGASSTQWSLQDQHQGTFEPLSGYVFNTQDKQHWLMLITQLRHQVCQYAAPTSLVLGITGLTAGTPEALWMQEQLHRVFQIPLAKVLVADDLSLVYLGNFKVGEGILVYGGTGSIAVRINTQGVIQRAGGYGYLIDDAGGGFWIGQQALKHWLKHTEGGLESEPTPLSAGLMKELDSCDWPVVRSIIYSQGRRKVASLVPVVVAAALQGDLAAHHILNMAGQQLGDLANSLAARNGQKHSSVILLGGVCNAGAPLVNGFKHQLTNSLTYAPTSLQSVEAINYAARRYAISELRRLTSTPPT